MTSVRGPFLPVPARRFEHLPEDPRRAAILRAAQNAYVTDSRPLVSGDPSYMRGAERSISVTSDLYLDLDAMVDASNGAGLVFLCNPNNPTSTIYPLSDIETAVRTIKRRSPNTAVLIDEA